MIRIALFVAALCAFLPTQVHATTGGPSHTQVLGYDAADAKIYYLIHPAGEVDDYPALFFVRLEGKAIGKPVFVKSYYPKGLVFEEVEDFNALNKRFARLKKRLAKLEVLARSKRSEEQEYGTELPSRVRGARVKRKVKKRWQDDNFVSCREVSLTIFRGKLSGLHSTTECGGVARVSALYQVPGRTEVVAMVSYKPDSDEGGYEEQRLVLLR